MSTLLYNPDKKNKQQFIEEFVVRTSVFEEIFNDIQTGKMKTPEQHYLIVGQRGSGKTTLLNRLKYAIEDDLKLNKWLIPIIFNEEQYHIIELVNIWENIASYLEDFYGFTGLSEEISKNTSKKDFEQITIDILIKALNKKEKKIVLFIDNIGDLLKKFDELEVRRLREILQTIPNIRLISGSPVTLESLTDYHQPLFEFFKVIQLKGLSSEETIILLKKLAEINNQTTKIENIINNTPSRIETLRTLSGGVPRTVALLFMVFIDDEHGNALTDLEKVLDMVTPLYKHRMDDLPTQQQKIVDAVAKNWDAVSVKELSETLRMESKIISAQLRQLEKNQVIEKRTTDTKNHIYLIKERFFNIWYLMRYGRKQDRQRVIWLVKFLELWCDGKEIEKRILNYVEKSKKGLIDKKTHELYGEVYSFFNKIKPETKLLLSETAPKYVYVEITNDDFDKLIDQYFKKKDWESILKTVTSIKRLNTEQKTKIFDFLDKNYSKAFLDLIASKFLKAMDNKSSHSLQELPSFYPLYFFHTGINMLSIKDDEKMIVDTNKNIKSTFKLLLLQNSISEFEKQDLIIYIGSLLSLKYYRMAQSFFDENFDKEIEDYLIKILYVLTQYFITDKKEKIFEKYSPEIRDTVITLSKSILNNQKKLNLFSQNKNTN
ncbi:MAG: ATP-binding protein [Bacteroidia bacterium]|nr:ATP-binding protein [Bacteroidia bacterium]